MKKPLPWQLALKGPGSASSMTTKDFSMYQIDVVFLLLKGHLKEVIVVQLLGYESNRISESIWKLIP